MAEQRLIDVNPLVSGMKGRLKRYEKEYGYLSDFVSGYEEAIDDVIDTPTVEAKPDWIPVKDHLPKIDEEVLVQDLFENIFVGKIYDPEKHNGKYGSYFINTQNHSITTGVAWMKKPTPYKDEKEGE